jgi:hypothetical protein
MRKLLAVAACGVGIWSLGACGGDSSSGSSISDPVDGCKQGNQVLCDKIFKCYTKDELDRLKDGIGLNSSDCTTKFNAQCTPEMQNCNSGETFHADKASECLDGFKTFTCDDIKRDPLVSPAACDQVCTK